MSIKQTEAIKPKRIEKQVPSMVIAGIGEDYLFGKRMDPSAQWQNLGPYLGNIAGQKGAVAYGVSFEMEGNKGIHYICGVEVSKNTKEADLPDSFELKHLPSLDYAVFEHEGHISEIRKTCDAIWHTWIPQSGYDKPDEADYFFERYGENFDPEKGNGDIEIWIPVSA